MPKSIGSHVGSGLGRSIVGMDRKEGCHHNCYGCKEPDVAGYVTN